MLHQVGGGQVGDVQLDGQGVAVVGFRDGKAAPAGRVVKAAHVPADGHRLLGLEPHEALDQEHALFPVAVGELVLHRVVGHLFPLAGGVVFDVAGGDFVVVGLAQVVEQRADGKALLAVPLLEKVVVEGVVDVQAVHAQAPLAGAVEPGGGRAGEKVGLVVQPVQQPVGPRPGDMLAEDGQKLFPLGHLRPPGRPARRGR